MNKRIVDYKTTSPSIDSQIAGYECQCEKIAKTIQANDPITVKK